MKDAAQRVVFNAAFNIYSLVLEALEKREILMHDDIEAIIREKLAGVLEDSALLDAALRGEGGLRVVVLRNPHFIEATTGMRCCTRDDIRAALGEKQDDA